MFQVPVNTDCPRSFTARFMASVWALFAVVFLAIYTASLAAFMITREEWDDFIGLHDSRVRPGPKNGGQSRPHFGFIFAKLFTIWIATNVLTINWAFQNLIDYARLYLWAYLKS